MSVSESIAPLPRPREQVIPQAENLFKIALFVTLLFVSFWLTQSAVNRIQALGFSPTVTWAQIALVVAVLATANCFLLVGLGVLAHEAVHKVLFKDVFWNDLFGGLLWAMGLVPFYANRQFHLTHHRHAHQKRLDPENPMHNHSFWVAFLLGSVVGLLLQYRIFFTNLLARPFEKGFRARLLKDILFILTGAAVYLLVLPAMGVSPLYTVGPTLLVLPLVFGLRAMSDHYGIPEVTRRSARRQDVIEGPSPFEKAEPSPLRYHVTGWVVETSPFLEWLWSHVNLHEVHHKYPYLAHTYLKRIYRESRDREPYLVAKGFIGSLRNLRSRAYYGDPDDMKQFLAEG